MAARDTLPARTQARGVMETLDGIGYDWIALDAADTARLAREAFDIVGISAPTPLINEAWEDARIAKSHGRNTARVAVAREIGRQYWRGEFMKLFLTGLGIGVGLGVLFAPRSGEVTRTKVRERFGGLIKGVKRQAGKAKDAVQETVAAHSEEPSGENASRGTSSPAKKDQAREVRPPGNPDPINIFSREDLMSVSGIGPALADKIISGRPYSSLQELLDRGILSQSTFAELEGEIACRERRSA